MSNINVNFVMHSDSQCGELLRIINDIPNQIDVCLEIHEVVDSSLPYIDLDKIRGKKALEEYAQKHFGVDLDRRNKLDDLKAEVAALIKEREDG